MIMKMATAKVFHLSNLVFLVLLSISIIETIVANDSNENNVCSNNIKLDDRIDCHPDQPITKEECLRRNCCWEENGDNEQSRSNLLPLNVGPPRCYFGLNYTGYKIFERSPFEYDEDPKTILLKRVSEGLSGFPKEIEHVLIVIEEINDEILRIKFIDNDDEDRFEVPIPTLNIKYGGNKNNRLYSVESVGTNLIIRRKSTKQIVFNVDFSYLIYSNQFIQITTKLSTNFLYGIGEHRSPFQKLTNWKRYTMLNRDPYQTLPNISLYGSHPFYLTLEPETNLANGLFLFNNNPMDIITQPTPAITFRTIGGILDFFLFLGPKPEDIIQQYQSLISTPAFPPYWSLGYHLCRYGYENLETIKKTLERNRKAGIPIDVQWTDIDMFDSNNDFTYDPIRFKGLPEFIRNDLHANGMKFIPMFDCGISGGEEPHSYPPFDIGVEMNVFIRNSTDQLFYGKVWNTKTTVWPDFFHPNATAYWTKMFEDYHKIIPFDGVWIDMNEPANMLNGQVNGCPESEYETPKYVPGMTDETLTLNKNTLCMTAKHYNGTLHYNLHNLYGLAESISTNLAIKNVMKLRPFIISRASAPGQGHWAFHWSGDINADWSSMQWTISSILNFNLFGLPIVGADICGFHLNTTEELCARWHQLGAFYTFARNHNDIGLIEQDPAAMGSLVLNAAKQALLTRYAHLPYLYTQIHNIHMNGGTVLRPLFFEFPNDTKTYSIETQFMWGSSIMVAPALSPNQTMIDVYFPKDYWYFVPTNEQIKSNGEIIKRPASFVDPPVYYRSGSIIPIQDPKLTTEETRKGNFTLVIVLGEQRPYYQAKGELFTDYGDGLYNTAAGEYNSYQFNFINDTLTISSLHIGCPTNQTFDNIKILGFDENFKFEKVSINTIDNDYGGDNGKPSSKSFQTAEDEEENLLVFEKFINKKENGGIEYNLDVNLPLYNEERKKIHYQIKWK